MVEIIGTLAGIAIGVLMVRFRRTFARASAGPGLRGPGTIAFPDRIVPWFGYAIFGVGTIFVVGGIAQIINVLVA